MLDYMASIESFAPLHNYHSMLIVKNVLSSLPQAPSVLTFDTLFHSKIAPQKYTYALPPSKKSTSMPLRQYGFHGLSYGSVLDQMASYLKKPPGEISLVVAHLGSGSSVCCIRNGESIDTSMGLTPLQGRSFLLAPPRYSLILIFACRTIRRYSLWFCGSRTHFSSYRKRLRTHSSRGKSFDLEGGVYSQQELGIQGPYWYQ